MKKPIAIILGILVSILALDLSARQLPASGAALKTTDNSIEINKGQSVEVELQRLRSKSYTKAKFGSIRINAPEGLSAVVKADESNMDLFIVTLTPSDQIETGKYTLTIQGEGRNASKVKATMLSITVNEANGLAKSK